MAEGGPTKVRAASSRASQLPLTPRSTLPLHVQTSDLQLAQVDATVSLGYSHEPHRSPRHQRRRPSEYRERQQLSSAKTTASTARVGPSNLTLLPPIAVRETIAAPPSVSVTSRHAVTEPKVAPQDWKFLSSVDIDITPTLPHRLLQRQKANGDTQRDGVHASYPSAVPALPLLQAKSSASGGSTLDFLSSSVKGSRRTKAKIGRVPNDSFQASMVLPQIITAVPPPSCKAIPESFPDFEMVDKAKMELARRIAASELELKKDSKVASSTASPTMEGVSTTPDTKKIKTRRQGSPLRGYASLRHNPPLAEGVGLARLGGFVDQPIIETYLDDFQKSNPPGTAGSALDFDATLNSSSNPHRRRPKRSTDLGHSLAEQLQTMADMCTVVLVGFAPLAADEPGYEEESLDVRVKLRSQYRGLHPVEHVKLASDLPTDLKTSIATVGKNNTLVKVEYEDQVGGGVRGSAQAFYVQPRALDYVAVRAGQWSGAIPTEPESRLEYLRERQKDAMAYFGFSPKPIHHKPALVAVS